MDEGDMEYDDQPTEERTKSEEPQESDQVNEPDQITEEATDTMVTRRDEDDIDSFFG